MHNDSTVKAHIYGTQSHFSYIPLKYSEIYNDKEDKRECYFKPFSVPISANVIFQSLKVESISPSVN